MNAAATGFAEAQPGTNHVTASITTDGAITTVVSGGKVTTVADNGQGGTGADALGAAGAGAATAGHGPLFYFYILFAAAIVIWIIWAVWHSYTRRHRPARVRYRRRRTVRV